MSKINTTIKSTVLSSLILAIVTGCSTSNSPVSTISQVSNVNIKQNINTVSSTTVKGRIDFSADGKAFSAKATLADIATKSTVSLIDPITKVTVVTGLSDVNGNFNLNPSLTFVPTTGQLFRLEASRRIGVAGNDLMSLRTLLRWTGTMWESITDNGIYINAKTTAIALMHSYESGVYSDDDVMNSITTSNNQLSTAPNKMTTVTGTANIINENFDAGIPGTWSINSISGGPTVMWQASNNTTPTDTGKSAWFGNASTSNYALSTIDTPEKIGVYTNWDPSTQLDTYIKEPNGTVIYYGNSNGLGTVTDALGNENLPIPNGGGAVYDESYLVSGSTPNAPGFYEVRMDNFEASGPTTVTATIVEDPGLLRPVTRTPTSATVTNKTSPNGNFNGATPLTSFTLAQSTKVAGELITPTIDMTGKSNGVVTWEDDYIVEPGFIGQADKKMVYLSTNGGASWSDISPATENNAATKAWSNNSYILPASCNNNPNVKIKFVFDSVDGKVNNYKGWNVDNVMVAATGATISVTKIDMMDFNNATNLVTHCLTNNADPAALITFNSGTGDYGITNPAGLNKMVFDNVPVMVNLTGTEMTYVFRTEPNKSYQVRMNMVNTGDAYLKVFNPGNNTNTPDQMNDDENPNTDDSLITIPSLPTAGTYRIVMTTADVNGNPVSNPSGMFNLSVKQVQVP